MKQGVLYAAYGNEAISEFLKSLESLRLTNPDLEACVMTDSPKSFAAVDKLIVCPRTSDPYGREAKLSANLLSPFDVTLYLDCDTRVYSNLKSLFRPLISGFDFVATLAMPTGANWLWHVPEVERLKTLEAIGYEPVQFQGGVWGFNKNERTDSFFEHWRYEWAASDTVFEQAAMSRALHLAPMRTLIMGKEFNGGSVVHHIFGRARRKDLV